MAITAITPAWFYAELKDETDPDDYDDAISAENATALAVEELFDVIGRLMVEKLDPDTLPTSIRNRITRIMFWYLWNEWDWSFWGGFRNYTNSLPRKVWADSGAFIVASPWIPKRVL